MEGDCRHGGQRSWKRRIREGERRVERRIKLAFVRLWGIKMFLQNEKKIAG
jgi:hypothetical protein